MTYPDRSEAPDYYFKYIDQVRPGDICEILRAQSGDTCTLLDSIADEAVIGFGDLICSSQISII